MIDYDRNYYEMIMTCDTCSDEITFTGEFHECIAEAKSDGWSIKQDKFEEWTHTCPVCVEKERTKNPFEVIE